MSLEFKVTLDTSVKADNDPRALEKAMNEMSSAGWSLTHVTSFAETGGPDDLVVKSRIYLFWQRRARDVQTREAGPSTPSR